MQKNTVTTLAILLIILLLVALVVFFVQQRNENRTLQQSKAASALAQSTTTSNFTDMEGNVVDLDQFLGQTLIVNSWASWAPSSASELTLLTDVARNFREQGVVVIAINRAEPRATAEAFLASLGLTDDVLLIVDADDRYYQAIGGFSMPETVIYDTKGDVIQHKRGAITPAELTQVLDAALFQVE